MGSSSHAFNSSETPGAQPRHPSDNQGNSVCVLPLTPELHTQDKSVQAISIANDTPKHVVPRPESQSPQPMVPQPMALDSSAPPPFLTKTYDMIDDRSTDAVVAWGANGNSFVVWNPPEFARDLLPKYFKHSNFSSFVRQLNTYGFRKVDPDRWEFANEGFLRGQKHLLKSIHRRKPSAHAPVTPSQPGQSSVAACVEVGKFGLEGEIERLKRDKNVLMMELVRLRQQQQQTDRDLHMMGQRLHVTEQRQQQMVSFLAKAMQNPSFLAQLVQQNEKNKRLATARKKRRLPKQDGDVKEHVVKASPEGQIIKYQPNSTDATRTMLSQFLNTPELGLKSDVPLDVLFRDLQSGAIEPRDSLGMPRITFTEVKGMPEQEVDQTNMLTSSGLESTLSGDSLENGYFMDSDGDKHGLKDDDSSMNLETDFTNGYDNQGSASIDDGTEINEMNDQSFWETLLNVSPGSQDTEADGDVDVDVDVGEIDLDVDATNNHWWSGAPNIEELAEQMEHLGSGPQVPNSKQDDASS